MVNFLALYHLKKLNKTFKKNKSVCVTAHLPVIEITSTFEVALQFGKLQVNRLIYIRVMKLFLLTAIFDRLYNDTAPA